MLQCTPRLHQERYQQQRNHVQDFNHRVNSRAGSIFVRVADRITGDGGLVATDDDDLYNRAFAFHDQGHTPNRAGVQAGSRTILGLNFRVNELLNAAPELDYTKEELEKALIVWLSEVFFKQRKWVIMCCLIPLSS